MKIVIAGGGTGGHIFPGIAVAKELKKTFEDIGIVFIGTHEGIEIKIIPQEGFDIKFIRSEGIVRRGFYRSLRGVMRVPLSVKDSYAILSDIKPDVVFGVGGYCSGPVLFSAFLMKIPTIIHEQNTIPGFTNKVLGKLVNTVAVTFHESMDFFSRDKTYLTGNPVRDEILRGDKDRGSSAFHLDKELFTIFVFGGSAGAHKINMALSEALAYLEDYKDKIQFLHQTGEKDFDLVREFYQSRGFKGTIIPFIYDMADAYAVADLVVSRAGATTIAELTACGKAAILIPYPHAAGDHQEVNAKKLWDLGAAQMIHDKDLNGKALSDLIRYLIDEPDAITEMERLSKSLGKSDATKKIVDLIKVLMRIKR
jgi:UDP-N-acetylglucosamine--N-acetylmuramyl-(pentapeptide) pyrophosphoryl-undecaprenol N-acetylglucosamine transferase